MNILNSLVESLAGKKTYLIGAMAMLAVAAFGFGLISQHDLVVILGILMPAQLAALRASVPTASEIGGSK